MFNLFMPCAAEKLKNQMEISGTQTNQLRGEITKA